MDNSQLEERIAKLEERLKELSERRINQTMVLPDVIKARHVGEGVRFIRSGITANKPTVGESTLQGSAVYFDETTDILYVYNNSTDTWMSEQLT